MALGAIVLAITGAEALYADMGHFGRSPIRVAWIGLVLPALVLNYFGQGALVLRDASALDNPFYRLAPPWLLWPLIGLATCATVIASQAVISGVFSLTRQAIQLDYLPRMTVRHTSATEMGQIYLPQVNWLLMVGVLLLVLGFRVPATWRPPTASPSPAPWASTPSWPGSSPPGCGAGRERWPAPCSASSCSSIWATSPPTCSRSRTAAGFRWRWRACSR